jgi:hypothetical protein
MDLALNVVAVLVILSMGCVCFFSLGNRHYDIPPLWATLPLLLCFFWFVMFDGEFDRLKDAIKYGINSGSSSWAYCENYYEYWDYDSSREFFTSLFLTLFVFWYLPKPRDLVLIRLLELSKERSPVGVWWRWLVILLTWFFIYFILVEYVIDPSTFESFNPCRHHRVLLGIPEDEQLSADRCWGWGCF